MPRTERQLDLLQLLRRHGRPVTGLALAATLGISLRTLCRDVASLQAQGAAIEGEPGLGYILRPDATSPPLMFTEAELVALAHGARWVAEQGAAPMAAAARGALARIAAIRPAASRAASEDRALDVGPGAAIAAGEAEIATIRDAIRRQRKLAILYRDPQARRHAAHDLAAGAGLR